MKKFSIYLLLIFLSTQVFAQTSKTNTAPLTNSFFDELSVKDSSGIVYPREEWQKLLSSGKYNLKMLPSKKDALLYKLSDEEYNKKFERMPKPKESVFFKTGDNIASFKETDIQGKNII